MSVDAETFRRAVGRFATGVTIVTAKDAGGRDHGMTVSAFAALSLHPPLVLVCIDRSADMFEVLQRSDRFCINVLAADQEPVSQRFCDLDPEQRFEGIAITRTQHGIAVLPNEVALVECRVTARHDGGDHGIFVAEVESAVTTGREPLIHFRGAYHRLGR
jgi:flavin reductase (DIM6/NTAB) family NADH-FMN oxidoreductase RutF